jgi:hypothetical protein
VRLEGLGKFKKIISSDIEPVTFQFVAQCLNHYATVCPLLIFHDIENYSFIKNISTRLNRTQRNFEIMKTYS